MICPKCGRDIPEGSVCPCSMSALSSNPAVNLLKTLGSSTLFMVAAILYSVAILLTIVSSATAGGNVSEILYYATQLDLDPSVLYSLVDSLSSVSIGSVIVGSVPGILTALGMWLFFASCRNRQSGNVSTSGLTICKVLAIISIVCICLAMLAVVVCCGALIIAGAMGEMDDIGYEFGVYYGEAIVVISVIVFIVAAVALVLALLYQVCVVKTINRIKGMALSGVPDNRISQYLIVMNYVMAVGTGLSGLASIATSPLSCLALFCEAAVLVMVSLLLSRCRTGMTMLMYPPVQPTYGGPQPPMPPQQGPWA